MTQGGPPNHPPVGDHPGGRGRPYESPVPRACDAGGCQPCPDQVVPGQRAPHPGARALATTGVRIVPPHAEVEALNPGTGLWRTLAPMNTGRHGTQVVLHDGKLYRFDVEEQAWALHPANDGTPFKQLSVQADGRLYALHGEHLLDLSGVGFRQHLSPPRLVVRGFIMMGGLTVGS